MTKVNIESKDFEIKFSIIEIYPGSNLSQLKGYEGWNIDSSLEKILKKKENNENDLKSFFLNNKVLLLFLDKL
jgi:hypothetical protein